MITPATAKYFSAVKKAEQKQAISAFFDNALRSFDGKPISINCEGLGWPDVDLHEIAMSYVQHGWNVVPDGKDKASGGPWYLFSEKDT